MDKEEVKKIYKNIEKVYCPYFKDNIYFTRTGFEHLYFKNKFRARNEKDQKMRVRLLPIAVKIIKLSNTLQGNISQKRFEERFIHNRKEIALVPVTYYEFMAIIDEKKVKVVIKQILNCEKIFLSIIPLFKQKSPPVESDGFSEHLATAECRDG